MEQYFLGANSRSGFASLYDSFPPGKDDYLHVIKGGPGTGKSSFLKAIARTAEARGMEVHRVLCSGDPDSLDGVYLPERKTAWVDGTAPHVCEPRLFGVTGDYINLTAFFARPFDEAERQKLLALQAENRDRVAAAYRLLRLCRGGGAEETALLSRPISRRFCSAVSCKGYIPAEETLQSWKLQPLHAEAFRDALETLSQGEDEAILGLSPLEPEKIEALLLPRERLAYVLPFQPDAECEKHLHAACKALKEAKVLHDEMEALYRPHMDFSALDTFTQQTLNALFAP